MSSSTRPTEDPLTQRVKQVITLVNEMRQEMSELRTLLDDSRSRIEKLEGERGVVRQRVKQMLENINS